MPPKTELQANKQVKPIGLVAFTARPNCSGQLIKYTPEIIELSRVSLQLDIENGNYHIAFHVKIWENNEKKDRIFNCVAISHSSQNFCPFFRMILELVNLPDWWKHFLIWYLPLTQRAAILEERAPIDLEHYQECEWPSVYEANATQRRIFQATMRSFTQEVKVQLISIYKLDKVNTC